jgi:uncharacterized protein YlbG (UPF0298 family)
MNAERVSLIVWLTDLKNTKWLEKFGNVVYISKKMKYAIIYINKDEYEEIANKLLGLGFVKKVERSLNTEVVEHFAASLAAKEN